MILVLDNYDSFVHTLAGYVRQLGGDPLVRRNDAISLDEIALMDPSHIIISPGPRTPAEAGIAVAAVRRFGPTIPMLGVCLGHQCIAAAYGARIVRARHPMHGRTSPISHDGSGVFRGLPPAFAAARYHSLVVERDTLPATLRITAESDDGEIMAVAHASHPVTGVQFHPESILSEHGHAMLRLFLQTERSAAHVA